MPEQKKQPECGKKIGILCSEYFTKHFDKGRIRGMILHLYKYHKHKFKEEFEQWTQNKDNKYSLNNEYLEGTAEHYRQRIKNQLEKRENNENKPDFAIKNLRGYVWALITAFLREETKKSNPTKETTLNQNHYERMKYIIEPSLANEESFMALAIYTEKGKHLTKAELEKEPEHETATKLKEQLEKIPGLGKAWYEPKEKKNKKTGKTTKIVIRRIRRSDWDEYHLLATSDSEPESNPEPPGKLFPSLNKETYNIFKNGLTEKELCVYKNYFEKAMERHNITLEEIGRICWDPPAVSSTVWRTGRIIIKKFRDIMIEPSPVSAQVIN
jgi:hypothetical protein